jgi:hypothetical protein
MGNDKPIPPTKERIMGNHPFERIQELGLELLKRQAKSADLVFAGAQVDTLSATGAKVFRIGAVRAGDPTGPLQKIVVNERGEAVDLKTVPEADRARLFGGDRRPWQQFSYAVKFVCGVQKETDGCCAPGVRPGAYATEINILNSQYYWWAYLQKRVVPVILGGLPLGREPRSVDAKGGDWMALPPGQATMDDCCRINHLLADADPLTKPSLNIGFLEIVSDVELEVTAVYTATDLENRSVSIDVEQITPKMKYPYWWIGQPVLGGPISVAPAA